MAVLITQTREELARSVGYQYGGLELHTMTSTGTTSSFVDSELEATDNYINGRWFRATSGTNNDGEIRLVDDYTGSSTTGDLRGDALTDATADGDTYELWPRDLNPTRVYDAINRSIRSIPRKGAPPLRDISLHTSSQINIFDIPTSVVGINGVSYRVNHTERVLLNCDSVWAELVDTDTTATAETEDRREGGASNKFVIAAGMSAGDIIAADSIASTDLSKYTHIEFWFKSTVTLAAGEARLILSASASAAAETDVASIPAITADTWTWVRVALSNPLSDTAIISIGLDYTADIGAVTYQIDGIVATVEKTQDWATIHRNFWRIDKDARQLILKPEAHRDASYSLLRLTGVKKPTELNADATSCDIEPEYIIMQSMANLMRQRGDRRAANRDAAFIEADHYEALALNALATQQTPNGVRWVSD